MRLLKLMNDTGMFRKISIGEMHVRKQLFYLFIDVPSNNPHLGCISKPIAPPLYLVLLMCSVDEIMAGLTQSDEIIGSVTACFS